MVERAAADGAPDEHAPSYEELIGRLEATVERLESGDLALDEALAAYEEGTRVATQAQRLLDTAEQRIRELQEPEEA